RDADSPGAGDHEGGLGKEVGHRPRRLRGDAEAPPDRLHDGHDDDEHPGAEGPPAEAAGGPLLRLPAGPAAAPGGGGDGARVPRPGLRRVRGAAPRPPGGGPAADQAGRRRARPADPGGPMSLSPFVLNLAAYSAQLMLLALAAGGLARVMRLRSPRAMLAYWQGALVLGLALPLVQPWRSSADPARGFFSWE